MRSAVLWALVFGAYVASKAIGFVKVYPTPAAQQKILGPFSSNTGIEVILGPLRRAAETVPGYVAWNTLSIMVIVGVIWAFLITTKTFRGEENAGRWELLLSGQTTARKAAVNALAGLGVSLALFYVIMGVIFTAVGKYQGVNYSTGAAFFLALAVASAVMLFVTVGALASQLMSTRTRAASTSAAVFGIFFLLRVVADMSSAHWLLNLTPLGWVEKLQPLSGSQPVWLIPIIGLSVILGGLTIYFAGKRDLEDSIFADKDTAKPRTTLLNSPFALAIRLTRTNSISWLIAFFAAAVLYGSLIKAEVQAVMQSTGAEHVISRLAFQSQGAVAAVFLGIIFLLQMLLIMSYVASSVAAIRRDEASGYIDNFLVRPVSRLRWLAGRIVLIAVVLIMSGLVTVAGVWVGIANQHVGVPFHSLFLAGINALVPVALTVGVGIFAFGVQPRLTSILAYGVLVWSFLISMVSSGLNLNHWVLDTSVLHQIVLAPSANPNWSIDLIIFIISVVLCMAGAIVFNRRDLASE
jgi:ABC-2 type transport system permease protein